MIIFVYNTNPAHYNWTPWTRESPAVSQSLTHPWTYEVTQNALGLSLHLLCQYVCMSLSPHTPWLTETGLLTRSAARIEAHAALCNLKYAHNGPQSFWLRSERLWPTCETSTSIIFSERAPPTPSVCCAMWWKLQPQKKICRLIMLSLPVVLYAVPSCGSVFLLWMLMVRVQISSYEATTLRQGD